MNRNWENQSKIIKLLLWILILLKIMYCRNCDLYYYVADWSVGVIHFCLVYLDALQTSCIQQL